jgi:hypothetical protein
VEKIKIKTMTSDELDEIKLIDNCRSDLRKLFIRFRNKHEAESMRRKGNLHNQLKSLFAHLNLNLDILPVESAYFQTRKFGRSSQPELTLCCIFTTSTQARKVKYAIENFNSSLASKGQGDRVRYQIAVSWSHNVWNIVTICNELRDHKLIEKHLVTDSGIKVVYKKKGWKSDKVDPAARSKNVTARSSTRSAKRSGT